MFLINCADMQLCQNNYTRTAGLATSSIICRDSVRQVHLRMFL